MKTIWRLLAFIGVVSCQSKTLEIDSDTSWSGSVGGTASSTISGSGSSSIPLHDVNTICWSIQKQTTVGHLHVYATVHTITGTDREGDATTTASYGVVSGCTQ